MRRLAVLAALIGLTGCGADSTGELMRDVGGRSEFVMLGELNSMVAAVDRGAAQCFHGKTIQFLKTYVGRSVANDGSTEVTVFQFGVFDPVFLAHINISDLGGGRLRVRVGQSGALPREMPDLVKSWAGGISICALR